MVGQDNLHHKVLIVCAGNRAVDRAVVNTMSTAMQSRLIHAEMVVDVKQWLDWAYQAKIDHRITGYINFRPDSLHNFKPDHQDRTFACPRTWEFANRIVQGQPELDNLSLKILSGTLSDGVAVDFVSFAEIYTKLPTFDKIIADPSGIDIPRETNIKFALTTYVADNTTPQNIEKVLEYIDRFPTEMQIVFYRFSTARDPSLRQNPKYTQNILKLMRYLQDD